MTKYDQILKEGKYDRALQEFKKSPKILSQMKKIEACDGTYEGVPTAIADDYSELRKFTIESYKTHCLTTTGYFANYFVRSAAAFTSRSTKC